MRKLIPTLLLALLACQTSAFAQAPSYRNEVMAVLAKAGCNTGTCHGNKNGKGGFRLSLRGEDPAFDLQSITLDLSARRIDLVMPNNSLLLQKANASLAHEGGKRFSPNSPEHRILSEWIRAGAKDDPTNTPSLTRIHVTPNRSFLKTGESVKIAASALFSDHSTRDITALAVFESSNPAINVSPDGRVSSDEPGETTITVRYLNQQLPVSIAFIPPRPNFVWTTPASAHPIDSSIHAKLQSLRVNPSPTCDDRTFLRRIHLDLTGRQPAFNELQTFAADPDANKRSKATLRLLESPDFADFWALKWSDVLKNEERQLDENGVTSFHQWIRQSILDHTPLDRFVREMVSALGSTRSNPPANFYRANRSPVIRAETIAQIFLGIRLNCAQCHNHPFDRWTQDDYYDWAAVFARIDYDIIENKRGDKNDKHEFKGEQVVKLLPSTDFKNARTGSNASMRLLGADRVTPKRDQDELQTLATWLTAPMNRAFARAQANRVWFHLMGRGLVEPLDDIRPTNPASHPELLDHLASELIGSGFNLRHLIHHIITSQSYQTSSTASSDNQQEEANYAFTPIRRLTAEQALDLTIATLGTHPSLRGTKSSSAISSPFPKDDKRPGRSAEDRFLDIFGKPPRLIPSECERSNESTLRQAFTLMSGDLINTYLQDKANCLSKLLEQSAHDEAAVTTLFRSAILRDPSREELGVATSMIQRHSDRRKGLEDVAWSLLNSKEFLFRE